MSFNNKEEKRIISQRENVYSDKSNKSGVLGFIETLLRRFRVGFFVIALLPLYMVGVLAMGISVAPGLYVLEKIYFGTQDWWPAFHYIAMGFGVFFAYWVYGMLLLVVVPFFNWIIPLRIKPFRGSYFSVQSIPWFFHNALTYIVRYTFLEFVTPTPLNLMFYRLMGMKIGKHVQINTTNISDPALIEIGDYVTIGGSAHIFAHYGQKGYLVLSRVKIGDGVNVGLKATIMGDVEIGAGAMIAPHEVILPKSRIPEKRKPPKPVIRDARKDAVELTSEEKEVANF